MLKRLENKRVLRTLMLTLVLASGSAVAFLAHAAPTVYYERADFLNDARVSGVTEITFDDLSSGTDLTNQSISGVTFEAPGSGPLVVIKGSDGVRNPMSPSTGENILSPGGSEITVEEDDLSLTFANPINAVGLDVVFDRPDGASFVQATFYDADNAVVATTGGMIPAPTSPLGYRFVGLVTDATIIKRVVFDDFDPSPPDENVAYDSIIFTGDYCPVPDCQDARTDHNMIMKLIQDCKDENHRWICDEPTRQEAIEIKNASLKVLRAVCRDGTIPEQTDVCLAQKVYEFVD